MRLGEGSAEALSPDQKWVIAQIPGSPAQFRLLPTKAGEAQSLTNDAINHNGARWLPDGKKFVFSGNEPSRGGRLYVQDTGGGQPLPIAPEGVNQTAFAVSPDGQMVAAIGPDQKGYLYPTAGHGDARLIPGLEPGDLPTSWSQDGHSLFVYQTGEVPARVYRVDLAAGKRTLWKQLVPGDPAGVATIGPILVTPDGKSSSMASTEPWPTSTWWKGSTDVVCFGGNEKSSPTTSRQPPRLSGRLSHAACAAPARAGRSRPHRAGKATMVHSRITEQCDRPACRCDSSSAHANLAIRHRL